MMKNRTVTDYLGVPNSTDVTNARPPVVFSHSVNFVSEPPPTALEKRQTTHSGEQFDYSFLDAQEILKKNCTSTMEEFDEYLSLPATEVCQSYFLWEGDWLIDWYENHRNLAH